MRNNQKMRSVIRSVKNLWPCVDGETINKAEFLGYIKERNCQGGFSYELTEKGLEYFEKYCKEK